MTIKKAYVELVALLEANKNKKVSTILDEVKAMCESKNTEKTFIKDDNGEVVAILCYYFKKWMPLCDVEFGKKASTATGYNTMCKSGVSAWTKQQREAKKANELLLERVSSGEVAVESINDEKALIEETRKAVKECDEICFDTEEQVLAYLNGEGEI